MMALAITAEQKILCAHDLKSHLGVESDRAGVVLPDTQPQYVGPGSAGHRDGGIHEKLAQAMPVPITIGIEARHLGCRLARDRDLWWERRVETDMHIARDAI